MSIYQSILLDLLQAGNNYKNRKLNLEQYKQIIWDTSCNIVSIEEKDLRNFLQQAEAEIDSISFIIDEKDVYKQSVKIVNKIESRIIN